jgi:hypothetical protein
MMRPRLFGREDEMKALSIGAAASLLALSLPATSATYDLGLLDRTKAISHAFSNYTGDFTDIYTFTLAGTSSGVAGDTTTINFSQYLNVDLLSATLAGNTFSGKLTDSNPNDAFSFSGLTGGGSYSLSIKGRVTGSGLLGVTGMYAGYVSPVPEPEAIGLALVGLLGTGLALRRRK